MPNETWSEFKKRIWGTDYEIWHDGVEPGGLEHLIEREGEHVKNMLFAGLAKKDYVAVLGMHSLPPEVVLGPLRASLARSAGRFKAEAARLLYKIDEPNHDQYVQNMIEVLQSPDPDAQMHVSEIMAGLDDPRFTEALLEQVAKSDNYLVRANAANALLKPDEVFKHQDIFNLLRSESKTENEQAATMIKELKIDMKRSLTLHCFTPLVTLTTFVIETAAGLYALVRYRRTLFGKLSALLILLLAVFQLSEYMICKTGQPAFWTQLGWVSITVIPVVGFHLVTMITGRSRWVPTGYAMAAFFSAAILFDPALASDVTCPGNYVRFASTVPISGSLYCLYYFWFIFFGMALLARLGWKTGANRELIKWILAGYAAFLLPTFVVYVAFPAPSEAFPSVLCGFAVFLAVIVAGKVLPLYHARKAAS